MKVLITGSAGFIGFHLSELLLQKGYQVIGIDNLCDYYDVKLKENRINLLKNHNNFKFYKLDISSLENLNILLDQESNIIVHLAAQAGVRYSIENPNSYTKSNLLGTQNILELARKLNVRHLLISSTSSVYGANTNLPFIEKADTNHPLSYYAATKKANEVMAHSYSYMFGLPITLFRFFTVYGPWGRPDMALFKFTNNIFNGLPIDVYNGGKMERDFTFVTDLVKAIEKLINCVPEIDKPVSKLDSLSAIAPHRIVNIGNSNRVPLMYYINCIEQELGMSAKINFMPMQVGDVQKTEANNDLLHALTLFKPNVSVEEGIGEFIKWFRDYYGKH